MKKSLNYINRNVRNLSAYHLNSDECDVKLNQNENPYDWPSDIKEMAASFIKKREWNRYPEFIPVDLKKKIANYRSVSSDNVIVGNGSNEMLLVLMLSVVSESSSVIISEPTFSVYKLLATGTGKNLISVPQNDDFSYNVDSIMNVSKKNPGSFLILCSPNNPTGYTLSEEDVERIAKSHEGFFLLDQAYFEFGGYDAVPLINKYSNLIITGTFSKALGGAGLRVGYMIGDSEIISEINKIKLPYNINFATEFIAGLVVDNAEVQLKNVESICTCRKKLYNFLKSMPFEFVYHSDANFIMCRTGYKSELFDFLKEKGILVRDVSSYPMLDDCLRFSIGTEDENRRLEEAIRLFFQKK